MPRCSIEGPAEAPAGEPTACQGRGGAWRARAAASFQRSCAGCHAGGGNVIQAGAGLTLAELQRNGVSTVDSVYDITYSGKGRMPGYGAGCKPRGQCTFGPRLSDEEIRVLAEFVLQMAAAGWKAP